MKMFDNVLSFFKRKKKRINQDTSRLIDENNTFRAIFSDISSAASFINVFDGSKIKGSLNYPSLLSLDTTRLRERSRTAIFDSPQSAAALNRLTEHVINSGLTLEITPMWNIVKPKSDGAVDKEERKKWTKKVEQYWKIFANSKDVSYDKKKTFQQLQSIFYYNILRDGEIFIMLRYSAEANQLNPLTIQIIDPANIQDPDYKDIKKAKNQGNKILDGIEFNKKGEEVAYYVCDSITLKTVRVEKNGTKSKRVFMLHPMLTEYSEQTRGIPFLSGVLHEMQKITDYGLLELQAAIINAVLAVWVKPSETNDSSAPFAGVRKKDIYQEDANDTVVDQKPNDARFSDGGLIIQNLKKGENVESFDTKRPNVNFDGFVTSVLKNLSSSLSIPMEVLTMTFGQNYSASRASLLLFWTNVIKHRSNFIADILNPIFEMWMVGEVEAGRILAPGFQNKLIREGWLNKRWIGISQPSIDPLKEGKAVTSRLADGLTTREIESQKYNGTSFEDNVVKLKEENELLSKANEPIVGVDSKKNNEEADNEPGA